MSRRIAPAGLAALALLGCTTTETETRIENVYEPYVGDAYPNQRPKLTLPDGDLGLTSDSGSDTVTALDLEGLAVIGSAPVGRSPVDNDGPHHLAGDRARGFVYVALAYPAPAASPGPHAGHGSSARDGFVQKLALDDLRVLGEVRVETNPGDIVLSEDGARLVVSHFHLELAMEGADADAKRSNLLVVDPAAVLAEGSPDPVTIKACVAPHGVALSKGAGSTAFVACYGEDAVAVVDLEDPSAEVVRVPVGPGAGPPGAPAYGPYSAALSADGSRLAIGSTESKDVRFLDVAAKAMEPIVLSTLGAPYFAAWSADGARLFVPTQVPDAIVIVDPVAGAELSSRVFAGAECVRPHEAVLGTGGTTLYVVCEGDHETAGSVLALDPDTLETGGSFTVGVYPDRLAILPSP